MRSLTHLTRRYDALSGLARGAVHRRGRNGSPMSWFCLKYSRAGKTVALLVQRADAKIFVPVELDKQG